MGFGALVWVSMFIRVRVDQASEGHLVDALVPRGDEGRDTLRKAWGSRE